MRFQKWETIRKDLKKDIDKNIDRVIDQELLSDIQVMNDIERDVLINRFMLDDQNTKYDNIDDLKYVVGRIVTTSFCSTIGKKIIEQIKNSPIEKNHNKIKVLIVKYILNLERR